LITIPKDDRLEVSETLSFVELTPYALLRRGLPPEILVTKSPMRYFLFLIPMSLTTNPHGAVYLTVQLQFLL